LRSDWSHHICPGCTSLTGPRVEHVIARYVERVIAHVPDYYEQYGTTSRQDLQSGYRPPGTIRGTV
jgi:hypothetical protein